MATQPTSDETPEPVLALSPIDIEIGDRIGLFWPEKAAAFGAMIRTDGQNDPIKVFRNGNRAGMTWRLVAGLHRLEGIKAEGLPVVYAIEVFGDEDQLRDIEASENIHRRGFGPIERARFVRSMADIAEKRVQADHEGLSQQQIAVRKRWAKARNEVADAATAVSIKKMDENEALSTRLNFSLVYSWRDGLADAMGLSVGSIKKDLELHSKLIAPFPELSDQLARHPLGDNGQALREIMAVPLAKRAEVIRVILDGEVKTVEDAINKVENRQKVAPATGAYKWTGAIKSSFKRLNLNEQRDFMPEFVSLLTPGLRARLRDLLNEENEETGDE